MEQNKSQRRYTPEFKKDAVALLVSSGRPIVEVARELGVFDASLGTWAREQGKKGTTSSSAGDAEKEETTR